MERMLSSGTDLSQMRQDNQQRVGQVFVWQQILAAYASLLSAVASRTKTRDLLKDKSIWKQHTT
jgi:hypothetical protein